MRKIFIWQLEPPADYKKAYGLARLAGNAERLRIVAFFIIAMFFVLLAQYVVSPPISPDSVMFGQYIIIFSLFLTGTILYVLFDKAIFRGKGSPLAQFLFVILILAGTTSLAILDQAVTGDLTAFFLGLIIIASLFRCRVSYYVFLSVLSAIGFFIGLFIQIGKAPDVSFLFPLAIDIVCMVFLSIVISHYDILAFCLQAELKAALTEKEIILKEVHHRIKNNMNTIYGLLILKSTTLKDPLAQNALEDAGSRVMSMLLLYDKLFQSQNFVDLTIKPYVTSLIDDIMQNFPNSGFVSVQINIDDFSLNVKKLQPLGIIINELLTNSMKYAFIGKDAGIIAVSASCIDSQVVVTVSDNGVGIPKSLDIKSSTGFGLTLVVGLTEQLSGTVRIERDKGTKFILEFSV